MVRSASKYGNQLKKKPATDSAAGRDTTVSGTTTSSHLWLATSALAVPRLSQSVTVRQAIDD